MTCHSYYYLFMICSGKTVVPAAQLQWCPSLGIYRTVEANREIESCPGLRTVILSCPFFSSQSRLILIEAKKTELEETTPPDLPGFPPLFLSVGITKSLK